MIHFASIAQMQNANAYLRNQISQAKLQQDNYHHQQLMSLNQAKMELDRQMQSEKMSFERYKFDQTMAAQREQSQSQIAVAEIQADSQWKQTIWQSQSNQTLAFMGMQGKLIEQQNQAIQMMLMRVLDFQLNEQMAQNNHERQKELLDCQYRIREMELKLQQKHDRERSLFEHNARVLEQVLGQKLKELSNKINLMDKFSYEKFEQNIADIVQEVLSMQPEKRLNEYDEEIGKAADKLARSAYSPY